MMTPEERREVKLAALAVAAVAVEGTFGPNHPPRFPDRRRQQLFEETLSQVVEGIKDRASRLKYAARPPERKVR